MSAVITHISAGAPPIEREDDMILRRVAPGKWHADLAVSRGPGKTPSHKKTTIYCETKREVMIRVAEWLETIGKGSLTIRTFGQALDKYESIKSPTALHNNRAYRRLLRKRFGGHPLSDKLDSSWAVFVQELRARGTSQGGINRYAGNMHAILRLALGPEARLPINAWGTESVPPRDVVLTDAQQEMVLQRAWARETARHIVPILEYNFLVPSRYGELEGARVADLNLIGGYFLVSARAGRRNKGRRTMRKPIPPAMRGYFETLPSDTEYLFYRRDRDGVCRRLGSIKRTLGHVLDDCELRGVWCFRDGRHAAYSNLVKAGTPKSIAQSIAGWATDMERVYYHQDADEDLRRVRYAEDAVSDSTEDSTEVAHG